MGRTESGSNGADYLFGNIDELRVWNKARNGKQIKSTSQDTLSKNYYSTKDSGLVAYYRFDEVIVTDSDSTLKDLSVESNDGTVIGKVEFDSSVIITNLPQKAFPKAASNFQLLQNYPNPFNPITTIRYELSENSKVNISVFDLTGRKIKTLASGQQSTGVHELVFDASVLTSGVYIYKLITNSFEKSRKMIVLK
ncbi:MAG: T9SS C-terminal target domain-containing protein [Calditrichaeota bacterium]|nr:MAG: T9SS C-terminal target domain-containing protein [Calditrichota bacterium]MBL1207867.1 T9SS C-terminal target domain-containing protein [Calditrichota bacterium]NOG47702.1 T9SS type A sorting domain-containing protein [Calditrichota bacterium]